MIQLSMFAKEDRLKRLSQMGDSLEKLKDVNWEMFRTPLQEALQKKEKKGKGGRPVQNDCVMMSRFLCFSVS